MDRTKSTHRPSAPKAARLPTRGQGDREAITRKARALDLMAVGAEMASAPHGYTGGSHPNQHSQRGTHERRHHSLPRFRNTDRSGPGPAGHSFEAGVPDSRNANTRAISCGAHLRVSTRFSERAGAANTGAIADAGSRTASTSVTAETLIQALISGSRRLRCAGAIQLRPVFLPVFRAHLLQGHPAPGQPNNRLTVFCRDTPRLPVPYGSSLDSELLGQLYAPSQQGTGLVNRVVKPLVWDACLMFHAITLTRFVFINQHHVLTRNVFNRIV